MPGSASREAGQERAVVGRVDAACPDVDSERPCRLLHGGDDRRVGIDLRGRVVRVPAPCWRMESEPVVRARGLRDGRLDLAPRNGAVAVVVRVCRQVGRVQGDVAPLGDIRDERAAAYRRRVDRGGPQQRMPLVRTLRPAGREPVERGKERHGLRDRVDPSPLLPGRLVHLGVRRATLDRQRAVEKSPASRPRGRSRSARARGRHRRGSRARSLRSSPSRRSPRP